MVIGRAAIGTMTNNRRCEKAVRRAGRYRAGSFRICGPSASHTEPLKTLRFLAMGKRKAISRTKPSAWLKRVLTEAGWDKVKVVVNFQHGHACQIETNLIRGAMTPPPSGTS